MTTTTIKTVAGALFCTAALVASGAQAADAPGVGNKNFNALTQKWGGARNLDLKVRAL